MPVGNFLWHNAMVIQRILERPPCHSVSDSERCCNLKVDFSGPQTILQISLFSLMLTQWWLCYDADMMVIIDDEHIHENLLERRPNHSQSISMFIDYLKDSLGIKSKVVKEATFQSWLQAFLKGRLILSHFKSDDKWSMMEKLIQ